MKYKVRVSELRYGEVEVEAASEREAKNKATRMGFNFFRTASVRLRCSGTLTQTALRHSALTVASV